MKQTNCQSQKHHIKCAKNKNKIKWWNACQKAEHKRCKIKHETNETQDLRLNVETSWNSILKHVRFEDMRMFSSPDLIKNLSAANELKWNSSIIETNTYALIATILLQLLEIEISVIS